MSQREHRRAFTLLETIIYIALVAIVLGAEVLLAITIFKDYAKISAIPDVSQNARFAMDKITLAIRGASAATSPTMGISAPSLTLTMQDPALSPTVIGVTSGVLTMQQGTGPALPLTANTVKVTNLTFTNLLDPTAKKVTERVVPCPPQANKRLVCHLPTPGTTICVNLTSVPGHLGHGDFLGPCTAATTAKDVIRVELTISTNTTAPGSEYQSTFTLYDNATIRRSN